MHKKAFSGLAAAAAMAAALGFAMAPAASAHGTGNSKAHGDCSAGSTWYLKADGNRGGEGHTVEVKFRISTAMGGEVWDWQISDNGTVAATGESTTDSNGNFQEKQSIPNLKGPDTVDLLATNTVTGETCMGEVVLKGSH
jgi:hypothetical protein